jgi:hypothetical protein
MPAKVVAQLMGHAKVDTTPNMYTQVIDGALRTAVDKVGSELFTIVHKPENDAELSHRTERVGLRKYGLTFASLGDRVFVPNHAKCP